MADGLSFSTLLYRPVFDRLAVPADLTLTRGTFTLPALDKTTGLSLDLSGLTVETMTPIVELMMADLTTIGVTPDELDGETITLNGRTWAIVSHRFNGVPTGISDGTLHLVLEGEDA